MDYSFHNTRPWHHGGRSRSLAGITLIEVMMSAMVVSLGIMGLVALIPLGTHLTERGTRADRVASIGERVYHEAKIRGYLNPFSWVSPSGGGLANFTRPHATHLTAQALPVRQPYLIDPWFFPDDSTEGNRRFFPASQQFAIGGDPTILRMHRLSVLSGPNSGTRMPRRQAAIAFMSEDDLSSERPSGGDRPPFQTYFTRGNDNTPVRRQSQGDFTWMLMLVPELRNIQPLAAQVGMVTPPAPPAALFTPPINYSSGTLTQNARTVLNSNLTDEYNLSVIVMQRRQPRIPLTGEFGAMFTGADPSERVLGIAPNSFASSDGYSVGEVRLQIAANGTVEEQENMLRLSNGDWICLAGRNVINGYPAGDNYQWYRVSSVSEMFTDPNNGLPSIDVTFTGPDWSSLIASPNPPTHAIIVEGVVGVYTKRVRLDLSTY